MSIRLMVRPIIDDHGADIRERRQVNQIGASALTLTRW